MDTIGTGAPHEAFDQIAERLVLDMRTRYDEERSLSRQDHLEIAAQLDRLGTWKLFIYTRG